MFTSMWAVNEDRGGGGGWDVAVGVRTKAGTEQPGRGVWVHVVGSVLPKLNVNPIHFANYARKSRIWHAQPHHHIVAGTRAHINIERVDKIFGLLASKYTLHFVQLRITIVRVGDLLRLYRCTLSSLGVTCTYVIFRPELGPKNSNVIFVRHGSDI